jgi:hypothetical protein
VAQDVTPVSWHPCFNLVDPRRWNPITEVKSGLRLPVQHRASIRVNVRSQEGGSGLTQYVIKFNYSVRSENIMHRNMKGPGGGEGAEKTIM